MSPSIPVSHDLTVESVPSVGSAALLWVVATTLGISYGFQYTVPENWLFTYFSVGSMIFFGCVLGLLLASKARLLASAATTTSVLGLLFSASSLVLSLYFFSKSLPIPWVLVAGVAVVPAGILAVRGRRGYAIGWLSGVGLLAMSTIAILEPIDVAAANMLPIIQAACGDIASGTNPYTKTYPGIATLPLYYFPALWLPYCPLELMHLDVRWLNVALNLVVVTLLAAACGAPRKWQAFGACVLPVMLSPTLLQMLIHGHLWPYWTMIAGALYMLSRQRLDGAAAAFAIGLGMRQLALFIVAPISATLLSGGPQAITKRVMLSCLLLAALLLPAAWAVDSFLFHFFTSIAKANADLRVHPGNPHDQIALSGLFPMGTSPAVLQACQAVVVLAGFGAALWAGRGRPTSRALLVAGCTYMIAVGLNPFVNRYFYVPGMMVLIVATAGLPLRSRA